MKGLAERGLKRYAKRITIAFHIRYQGPHELVQGERSFRVVETAILYREQREKLAIGLLGIWRFCNRFAAAEIMLHHLALPHMMAELFIGRETKDTRLSAARIDGHLHT